MTVDEIIDDVVGAALVATPDGPEILGFVQTHDYTSTLLDLQMTGSAEVGGHPVIALTGHYKKPIGQRDLPGLKDRMIERYQKRLPEPSPTYPSRL